MPTPVREQVLQALVAALETITAIPDLTVDRDRDDDVTDEELPILVVYEGEASPPEYLTGIEIRRLAVDVEGRLQGATRGEAFAQAALLRAEVERVLQADVTLGGTSWDVTPAEEQAPQRLDLASEMPAVGFVLSLVVTYGIAQGDPYTPA